MVIQSIVMFPSIMRS